MLGRFAAKQQGNAEPRFVEHEPNKQLAWQRMSALNPVMNQCAKSSNLEQGQSSGPSTRTNKSPVILAVLLIVLIQGCATKHVGNDQRNIAEQYAAEIFRDTAGYTLIPIGTKGEKTDALVLRTKAMTGYPSVPAEQLAKDFIAAQSREACIVVTGISSKFTSAIIVEALSLSDVKLPGLKLLFVGNENDQEPVRIAVKKRGGIFYFKLL